MVQYTYACYLIGLKRYTDGPELAWMNGQKFEGFYGEFEEDDAFYGKKNEQKRCVCVQFENLGLFAKRISCHKRTSYICHVRGKKLQYVAGEQDTVISLTSNSYKQTGTVLQDRPEQKRKNL